MPLPNLGRDAKEARLPTSAYDAAAARFEEHRVLKTGVSDAVRSTILAHLAAPRPRLLDLGAGTGRIGRAFVAAGDDYVGVDRSFGMLSEFRRRTAEGMAAPRLVQADGGRLPFRDACFDAVMLIQVFGAGRGWRRLLEEARRVLRPKGALVLGRAVAPGDGVDARMKQRLATILQEMGIVAEESVRAEAERFLQSVAARANRRLVAGWSAKRSPRMFLERHRGGARFAALPEPVRDNALAALAEWARAAFGSLEAARPERHAFELQIFRF